MFYTFMKSPLGQLLLAGNKEVIKVIGFPSGNKARGAENGWVRKDTLFKDLKAQLNEYFAGKRKSFSINLQPDGTPFQLSVLDQLLKIPYGETCTYGDIAKAIGNPKAVRAVGGANGNNPIPIILPCHRVIGSNGALTGFGGGIEAKKYLLGLEQNNSGLFSLTRSDLI